MRIYGWLGLVACWCSSEALSPQLRADKPEPQAPHVDHYGDPLPKHALLRLGTIRLIHRGRILGVFAASSGKMVTAVDDEGTVCVWDVATGKERNRLRLQIGEERITEFATLSPDRKTLAIDCLGGVGLWDSATGKRKAILKEGLPESTRLLQPTFSPDGKRLTVFLATGRLVRFDIGTGEMMGSVELEKPSNIKGAFKEFSGLMFADFSADKKLVAGSDSQREVFLWETTKGKLVRRFAEHPEDVGNVCLSPDGNMLASGCMDNAVRVWEVKTGKLLHLFKNGDMYKFAFSPDNKFLYVQRNQGSFVIYHLASGKRVPRRFDTAQAIGNGSFCVAPDGKTLLAYGEIGLGRSSRLFLWDIQSGKLLGKGHDAPVPFFLRGAAYAGDGQSIFMTDIMRGPFSSCRQYAIPSGKKLGQFPGFLVGVAADGERLLTLDSNNLCGFDLATKKRIWQQTVRQSFSCAELSTDGSKVVLESEEASLRVADAKTGELLKEYRPLAFRNVKEAVLGLYRDGSTVLSPNLDFAAFVQETNTSVQLLEWKTGKKWHQLKGFPKEKTYSLTFSPNAEFLLGIDGGSDGNLVLWHIPSGKKLGGVPEGTFSGFSPDAKLLALTTEEGLLLWDIKKQKVLIKLPAKLSDRGIVFSRNGRMMAVAGRKSVKIIEVASGKVRQGFQGFHTEILDVQFAPNSRTLLTVTENDVLVWDLTRQSRGGPGRD